MSLLSYQLQLKRYQRELGLSNRDFNALDRKHGDINLLKQLQILNPIVSAPASGWSGTITFNRTAGSGTQYIYIRTEAGDIVTDYTYTGANSFSVSLANAQSYVEIAFSWEAYWEIDARGFSIYIENTTSYYDDGLYVYRYSIPSQTTAQLTYNFTTFNND